MKSNATLRIGYAGLAGVGLAGLLVLGACGPTTSKFPEQVAGSEQHDPFGENPDAGRGRLIGDDKDGITLFKSGDAEEKKKKEEEEKRRAEQKRKAKELAEAEEKGAPVRATVNPLLWQATLDTLEFVPLLSADPYAGVVISDWHASPKNPNERFKIQSRVVSRELQAHAIRVQVFRQERNAQLGWVETEVSPETRLKIENAILTRARELRIKTMDK